MKLRPHIRVCAGFLAVLGVVTPVATAVHGALGSHAYCAEHSAFEEGPTGQSDEASHHGGVDQSRQDPASLHVSLVGRDSHESCPFALACFREATTPGAAAFAVPAAAVPTTSAFACLEAAPTGRLVLAVAPKTSPPRA